MTPDGYLRSVLVDGTRQFRHRGAVRTLLGEAPDTGVTLTFASVLPRPGFVYAAPVLARDVHSLDEEAFLSGPWLSDAVGDFEDSSDGDDTTRERPGASSLAGGVASFGSGSSVPRAVPATVDHSRDDVQPSAQNTRRPAAGRRCSERLCQSSYADEAAAASARSVRFGGRGAACIAETGGPAPDGRV